MDRVGAALALTASHVALRPFERTAGDELQGVFDAAESVVDVSTQLIEDGHWSVGIGIGAVELPLPVQTRAGRGPAFEAARVAVTRAKNAAGSIAVAGTSADDADSALALLAFVVGRRTPEGRAAVVLMRAGLSQAAAAERLGVSKQAVSQRLSVAGWAFEEKARGLAVRLLERVDQ